MKSELLTHDVLSCVSSRILFRHVGLAGRSSAVDADTTERKNASARKIRPRFINLTKIALLNGSQHMQAGCISNRFLTAATSPVAALADHINLYYAFWNRTAFLTKSGDLVLRVAGMDCKSFDDGEQRYAVKRLEAALKTFQT